MKIDYILEAKCSTRCNNKGQAYRERLLIYRSSSPKQQFYKDAKVTASLNELRMMPDISEERNNRIGSH